MSLADLARGLRAAGGVLSPEVQRINATEDQDARTAQRQEELLKIRHDLEQSALQKSPQYQMQQEALQNERLFREAATKANGDMAEIAGAAVRYGKPELGVTLLNNREARADRLQQAKDANERHLSELTMRLEDKALDRDSKEKISLQADETKKYLAGVTAELARSNQELKKMQFTMKADEQTQVNVRRLGTALEKANLPQADAVISDVEKALEKNPNIAEYISGPKSLIPDRLVDDDVKFGKQAFQKLVNITLKDRSGQAVTNQELERLKQEFATGAFKTPQQLKEGVDKARGIINKHYASVASGFGPDTLKAYNENIRTIGGKVVIEPIETPLDDPLGLRK